MFDYTQIVSREEMPEEFRFDPSGLSADSLYDLVMNKDDEAEDDFYIFEEQSLDEFYPFTDDDCADSCITTFADSFAFHEWLVEYGE